MGKVIQSIQRFTNQFPDSEFGPAHVVLSDYNIDDECIKSCLEFIERMLVYEDDYIHPSKLSELKATCAFLEHLLTIPETMRLSEIEV